MPLFKKKPVVIEAIQWTGTSDSTAEILKFIGVDTEYIENLPNEIIIHTLEGDMRATVNDYMIKGVAGEFYPCKPDIFANTYDSVEV